MVATLIVSSLKRECTPNLGMRWSIFSDSQSIHFPGLLIIWCTTTRSKTSLPSFPESKTTKTQVSQRKLLIHLENSQVSKVSAALHPKILWACSKTFWSTCLSVSTSGNSLTRLLLTLDKQRVVTRKEKRESQLTTSLRWSMITVPATLKYFWRRSGWSLSTDGSTRTAMTQQ